MIVANVLVPLDRARDGMERSILEMVQLLAGRDDLQLRVVAHKDSVLPRSVELVPCDPPPCPREYTIHGDGRSKWDHISNDASIHLAMTRIGGADLVHDLSSGTAACLGAAQLGTHAVKTLRLHPSHPSNGLTLAARAWTIHISAFQQKQDRWSPRETSSVIRDLIPLAGSQPGRLCCNRAGLVSIGRIEPRKGHDIAAQVAAALDQPLTVIGRVADADHARALGALPNVRLAGEMDHDAVLSALRRYSALVWTPRIAEPGGRVIVEALRAGAGVYAVPFGLASDIAEMQGLMPAVTLQDGTGVYRIETLPDEYAISPDAAAERYTSLYHKLRP